MYVLVSPCASSDIDYVKKKNGEGLASLTDKQQTLISGSTGKFAEQENRALILSEMSVGTENDGIMFRGASDLVDDVSFTSQA